MARRIWTRVGFAGALISASLLLAACAGKVNSENYGKVNNGMTQQEVEAILGPGTEQATSAVAVPAMPNVPGMPAATGTPALGAPGSTVSTKVLVWRSGNKMITVTLMNDKVMAKAQVGL